MPDVLSSPLQLTWPFALAFAWIAGEFGHRWTGLPRISIYGLAGFLFGNLSTEFLPQTENATFMLLANVAFGLILFELGYRINLGWLRINPWIAVTSIVESIGTFCVVFLFAQWYGTPIFAALLLASLAMSTSPAGILRVINEQRSSGQVTERVLHLSAMNCVLAVFAFKIIIGVGVFQSSGNLLDAIWSSMVVFGVSAGLGALFGVAVPALLRRLGNFSGDATIAFAIAVILVVAVMHTFKFSPVLATLTFGLVARHRRIALSRTQRNFGVVGDLLTVVLFFFVATTMEWRHIVSGLSLASILIIARFAAKTISVTLFSHISGISWRKGFLTGMALTPLSVFVILLLEQSRHLGVNLVDTIMPLAAMALLLEVIGPVVTQRALIWAKETPDAEDSK
jgi:Kef-type K+ transport system membrane component KefB